jgi:BMFP domain-containing protein YqiC
MRASPPEIARMIDFAQLDDLARRLSLLVPPGLRGESTQALRAELQQNFRAVLQSGLGKLDLVTREEFEVQRAVLLRTREKLEALQHTVAELEAQAGDRAPDRTSSGTPAAPHY